MAAAVVEASMDAGLAMFARSRAAEALVIRASGYGPAMAGAARLSAHPPMVRTIITLIVPANDSAFALTACVSVMIAHTDRVSGIPRSRNGPSCVRSNPAAKRPTRMNSASNTRTVSAEAASPCSILPAIAAFTVPAAFSRCQLRPRCSLASTCAANAATSTGMNTMLGRRIA